MLLWTGTYALTQQASSCVISQFLPSFLEEPWGWHKPYSDGTEGVLKCMKQGHKVHSSQPHLYFSMHSFHTHLYRVQGNVSRLAFHMNADIHEWKHIAHVEQSLLGRLLCQCFEYLIPLQWLLNRASVWSPISPSSN